MSGVDVRELSDEKLPQEKFPVSADSNFRLYFASEVHDGIQKHAKENVEVEICGVLVGVWKQDEHGPYADVQDYIRCDNASSKFAEVTFTHESWSQINREMDAKPDDVRILGWYHSHPDFGIFLSDRDCFIQENFFSGPGQVAYVVDPVRDLEGAFAWKSGKPELLPHYWIGKQICTSHASLRSPTTERNTFQPASNLPGNPLAEGHAVHAAPQPTAWSLSPTMQLLAWICVFLMGYILAGWRTSWERQRIIEGVVAHYGVDKVIKLGLQEDLAEIQTRLQVASKELREFSDVKAEMTEQEIQTLTEHRMLIAENIDFLGSALASISHKYSFSGEERQEIFRLVAKKHAQLQKLLQKKMKSEKEKSKGTDETSPTAETNDDGGEPSSAEPNVEAEKLKTAGEDTQANDGQKGLER